MPALQPPSMQIGALPPGWSPLPPTGPSPTAGEVLAGPTFIQQVANATTVATPASLTLTIAGTQPNSTLLLVVAVAATGTAPVITPPTNFVTAQGSVGVNAASTLGISCFFLLPANNPGSITSLVTNVTNANGIAAWVSEWGGNWLPLPYPASNAAGNYSAGTATGGAQGITNSGATPSNGIAMLPVIGPLMMWGAEADVTGQAYTAANLGGVWTTGTTATSTTGATLVVIRPFFQMANPIGAGLQYRIGGTLAAAIASGASMGVLPMATTGPLLQPFPQGEPGNGPQIGGWDAGVCPKPGGAGGGQ